MVEKSSGSAKQWMNYAILTAATLLPNFAPALVLAAQPLEFNYQAKLTDSIGAPLQGQHTLFVSLWDGGTGGTANSGVEKFAETATVAISVGVLNYVVGTGNNTFGGSLTEDIFASNNELFLQVSVDSIGNVILPRTRLESMPFAITSRNGVPAGFMISSTSPTAPAGYSSTNISLNSGGGWTLRGPMITGREFLGVAAAHGKLYAVGGINADVQGLPNNEEFDPVANSWSARAPMPTGRAGMIVRDLNGMVYAIGGVTSAPLALTLNEVYDPVANTWTTSQPLTNGRLLASGASANGQIYVFGGATDTNYSTILNSVEAFDPVTGTWVPKTNMPTARYNHMSANVNGIIYVVGGQESLTSETLTTDAFDPVANSWTTKASIPTSIGAFAAVGVGGKLYVITGATIPGGVPTALQPDLWIYDPIADAWSLGIAPSVGRIYAAAAVLNGTIYLGGGGSTDNGYLTKTESFLPQSLYFFSKD